MTDDLNMDFFFPDLNPAEEGVVPVPPSEMRFLELKAEPVADDGPTRLRVYLETTAFRERPHFEVDLFDAQGEEIASVSIIEPLSRKNVFTMHVRGAQKTGQFSLKARLFYPEQPDSDQREIQFEI
jgi:hypothetical protein